MQICRVKGNVWATRKEEALKGQKFLIVTKVDENQREIGPPFVAVDNIGAGIGELVIVTSGSSARKATGESLPIDAAVVGIIDSMDFESSG
ncbi:MAG: EutN/CcmL family microcompartment protein [Tepidanaerobacteraceae bacterium]|jgi:ethanolamine utilization protein EutN|nr:EutN/CcmL family microcompartment protein [Tepidanaerobacter sp.]